MKISIYALFLGLALMFVSSSCKKNPAVACNTFNIAVDLEAESNALSAAAGVYANNQTTENCNAYKNAYQDYIDGLRGLESCARAVDALASYQASLDSAEAALANLC